MGISTSYDWLILYTILNISRCPSSLERIFIGALSATTLSAYLAVQPQLPLVSDTCSQDQPVHLHLSPLLVRPSTSHLWSASPRVSTKMWWIYSGSGRWRAWTLSSQTMAFRMQPLSRETIRRRRSRSRVTTTKQSCPGEMTLQYSQQTSELPCNAPAAQSNVYFKARTFYTIMITSSPISWTAASLNMYSWLKAITHLPVVSTTCHTTMSRRIRQLHLSELSTTAAVVAKPTVSAWMTVSIPVRLWSATCLPSWSRHQCCAFIDTGSRYWTVIIEMNRVAETEWKSSGGQVSNLKKIAEMRCTSACVASCVMVITL